MNRPERYINLGRRSTFVEKRGRALVRNVVLNPTRDRGRREGGLSARKREKEEEEEGAAGHALNSPVQEGGRQQWLAQSRKHRTRLDSSHSVRLVH